MGSFQNVQNILKCCYYMYFALKVMMSMYGEKQNLERYRYALNAWQTASNLITCKILV
jgi:hypothetical protein